MRVGAPPLEQFNLSYLPKSMQLGASSSAAIYTTCSIRATFTANHHAKRIFKSIDANITLCVT